MIRGSGAEINLGGDLYFSIDNGWSPSSNNSNGVQYSEVKEHTIFDE